MCENTAHSPSPFPGFLHLFLSFPFCFPCLFPFPVPYLLFSLHSCLSESLYRLSSAPSSPFLNSYPTVTSVNLLNISPWCLIRLLFDKYCWLLCMRGKPSHSGNLRERRNFRLPRDIYRRDSTHLLTSSHVIEDSLTLKAGRRNSRLMERRTACWTDNTVVCSPLLRQPRRRAHKKRNCSPWHHLVSCGASDRVLTFRRGQWLVGGEAKEGRKVGERPVFSDTDFPWIFSKAAEGDN